ncbi:unnamed protein product, partial [Agarophyton chilense]
WANQLVDKLEPKLAEVDCQLDASKIADAIMKTKDDASNCPNTGDSLCSTLITVNECEDNPPDEEVVTEEAVPTRDCSGGLFCRARLVLTTKGTSTTVQAGYYIYPVSTRRKVDRSTRHRVKAVTQSEAMAWANQLLDKLGPKLAEVDCQLDASKIADAIMSTKQDASKCHNTKSSLCRKLVNLECEAEEDEAVESKCYKFIESDSAIDDLHALVAGCPEAIFYYNRIEIPLPLCTFTCPSDPLVRHTFVSKFAVQTTRPRDAVGYEDNLATLIRPAYDDYVLALPNCEDAPKRDGNFKNYFTTFYTSGVNQLDESLTDFEDKYGFKIRYIFFADKWPTTDDYIASVCPV